MRRMKHVTRDFDFTVKKSSYIRVSTKHCCKRTTRQDQIYTICQAVMFLLVFLGHFIYEGRINYYDCIVVCPYWCQIIF